MLKRSFLGSAALAGGLLLAQGALAAPQTGQQVYMDNCSACHQVTGLGIKGAFPALKASKLVVGPPPVLAATILNGRAGMPSFKDELSDTQIALATSYIRASWGNKAPPLKPADVAAARAKTGKPVPKNLQAH